MRYFKAQRVGASPRKWLRRAVVALGVIAAAAGPLLPLEVQASRPVTLTYIGYMAGLPVFSLTAKVSLPAGIVPGNGGYAVSAQAGTAGNFQILYPYQARVDSSGALKSQNAAPRKFQSVAAIMGRQEAVTLTYAAGGRVGINAQPLTRQAQAAASGGYANGTIDPASAIVAVVARFARTHQCQGTYKVFDGVRRYDLRLSQTGFVDLNPMQQSYYEGSATECLAQPQLLQGFSEAAAQSQFYPQSARLWLAPAVAGMPSIPVRIEAQNALGQMVLDLVQVQF